MSFDKEKKYIVTETDGSESRKNQVALSDGTLAQEGQIFSGSLILLADVQGPGLLEEEIIEEMVQKKGTTGLIRASELKKKKGVK